jgi:predicted amidophosphoribosyltransferase
VLVCHARRQKTYAFRAGAKLPDLRRAAGEGDHLSLKWERIGPLGEWFADAEVAEREGSAGAADIVVPVPVHRERQRRYEQAS